MRKHCERDKKWVEGFSKDIHKVDKEFVEALLYKDKCTSMVEAFVIGYMYALDRLQAKLEHMEEFNGKT